ncbi:AraC family transcriptional regulator [Roseovarius sp. D0-M9]|uniref:AraC family transcriptional regulator n=1 Tax=Roseovarius sp. D0-M9 TaxID=3127117 RepID=UPI00300FF1A1
MPITESKFRRFNRFEVAEFNCPNHVFSKHSHDEFVIGANIVGRETVTLDRRTFEVAADQITLYNPAQVQSSYANSANWSFVSIYLNPSELAVLTGMEEAMAFGQASLSSPFLAKSLITFVRDALDVSAQEEVLDLKIGRLLLDLLDLSGTEPPREERLPETQIRAVAEQLLDQIAEPPRLADIAAQHKTSPVALVRAFNKVFGLPPIEWLNVQRINNARQKLRLGRPLREVAHDLGYADQPHFNRRFKAATGMTPSTFLQMK